MSGDWRFSFPDYDFLPGGLRLLNAQVSTYVVNQFFVMSQSPGQDNGFVERKVF